MQKKDLIRQAAIKVIATEGYHNSKVQTIADEAEVANGTIYHYFKSKQDILEYIYRVEIDRRLKGLNQIENMDKIILEKLELFIRHYIKEWENNLDALKIVAQDGFSLIDCGMRTEEILSEVGIRLANLLEEGYRMGEIKKINFHLFSLIIINSLRGAVYEFNFGKNTKCYEKEKEQLICFLINGLKDNSQ